jgi:glycerol-3-phosphate cytidylyltransferase-like family protein
MQYKGALPYMTYDERKEILEACVYVSAVVPNEDGADSKPSILKIKPDIIAIGSDWAKKNYYEQMNFTQDWLDEQNISLIYIPYTKGISSSRIKKRL